MLGTRKDDPKARYSLVAHVISAFDGKSSYDTQRFAPSESGIELQTVRRKEGRRVQR